MDCLSRVGFVEWNGVEILAKLRLVGGEISLKLAAKISRAVWGPFFEFLHSLLGLAPASAGKL
jgi:hypothetical protein